MIRPTVQRNRLSIWVLNTAVLLLFVSVAGLRVVAKVNSGLPRSNPAHFTSAATKMEQTKSPVAPDRVPLPLVTILVAQDAAQSEIRRIDVDLPQPNQIALTPSPLRSPPVVA